MALSFPKGQWPVMVTPYKDNRIDFASLERLVAWYEEGGVDGLFAVCQSSEMFFMTQRERLAYAKFVKEHAHVPVVASGHCADDIDDQIYEINAMADTGVDAVIMITNRLADKSESDDVFLRRMDAIMKAVPEDIPLGFYECPYPYKRLLTPRVIKAAADTGRFYFLKDTCCDIEQIKEKLELIKGSNLMLFNANAATLLESLQAGACGFSGVMSNIIPKLLTFICHNWEKEPQLAYEAQCVLTAVALIERQQYPVNAKYWLTQQGVFEGWSTRVGEPGAWAGFSATFKDEVKQVVDLTNSFMAYHNIG